MSYNPKYQKPRVIDVFKKDIYLMSGEEFSIIGIINWGIKILRRSRTTQDISFLGFDLVEWNNGWHGIKNYLNRTTLGNGIKFAPSFLLIDDWKFEVGELNHNENSRYWFQCGRWDHTVEQLNLCLNRLRTEELTKKEIVDIIQKINLYLWKMINCCKSYSKGEENKLKELKK
ncbi:MAG: hypothetical protein ACRC4M_04105 [Mycoplasma sp.]